MDSIEKKPLVSILITTYNHEKYINQAIESIISQKADFSFELIIGEDASKDNTKNIIMDYEKKYPDIIKARYNRENIGMQSNFLMALNEAQGKYIAVCEGDDYWIDEYKLQKQVDLLEKNKEYKVCACLTDYLQGEKIYRYWKKPFTKEYVVYDSKHVIREGMCVNTPTLLFEKSAFFHQDIHWIFNYPSSIDVAILFQLSLVSDIIVLQQIMAVYRVHSSGFWTSSTSINKIELTIGRYNQFKNFADNELGKEIDKKLYSYHLLLIIAHLNNNDLKSIQNLKFKIYSPYLFYSSNIVLVFKILVKLILFFFKQLFRK